MSTSKLTGGAYLVYRDYGDPYSRADLVAVHTDENEAKTVYIQGLAKRECEMERWTVVYRAGSETTHIWAGNTGWDDDIMPELSDCITCGFTIEADTMSESLECTACAE